MNYLKTKIQNFLHKRKKKSFQNAVNSIDFNLTTSFHANDIVTFSHIGLIGDIIYAIPAMLALANGKNIHLYLDINHPNTYAKALKHYNNSSLLNLNSVTFICKLILSNPQFKICKVWEHEPIDFDLNQFRKYPIDFRMGHISRWYFLTFGVNYNLNNPWLIVKKNSSFKNNIFIARSFRYRTYGISYKFLNNYNNLVFIGLLDEFEDIKKDIPDIQLLKWDCALKLAEAIAGCKLFIGNQSFPFALAEGLKVKRVLEVCNESPNVIVDGDNGFDFCFQPQFEKIIKNLL